MRLTTVSHRIQTEESSFAQIVGSLRKNASESIKEEMNNLGIKNRVKILISYDSDSNVTTIETRVDLPEDVTTDSLVAVLSAKLRQSAESACHIENFAVLG